MGTRGRTCNLFSKPGSGRLRNAETAEGRTTSPTRSRQSSRSRSPKAAERCDGALPPWNSTAAAASPKKFSRYSTGGTSSQPPRGRGAHNTWAASAAGYIVDRLAAGRGAHAPQTEPQHLVPTSEAAAIRGSPRTEVMRGAEETGSPPQVSLHGQPSSPSHSSVPPSQPEEHRSPARSVPSSSHRSPARDLREWKERKEKKNARLALRDTSLGDVLPQEAKQTIEEAERQEGGGLVEAGDAETRMVELQEEAERADDRLRMSGYAIEHLFRRLFDALEVEERMGRDAIRASHDVLWYSAGVLHLSHHDQANDPFKRRRASGTVFYSPLPSTEPSPASPRTIKAETLRCLEMEHRLATTETKLFQAEVAGATSRDRIAAQDVQISALTKRLDTAEMTVQSLKRQLRQYAASEAGRASPVATPRGPSGGDTPESVPADRTNASSSKIVVRYDVQSEKPSYNAFE